MAEICLLVSGFRLFALVFSQLFYMIAMQTKNYWNENEKEFGHKRKSKYHNVMHDK